MKNITYTEALDAVINGSEITDEIIDKLSALKASLEKRNANRSSKPTKAQLFKETQREQIVEFLGDNPEATCAEVADTISVTLHSATGLLMTLRKKGIVRRDYKGKTPVYSLGTEESAE